MVPGTGTLGVPVSGTVTIGGQTHLTLEFVRRTAAGNPGVTYHVEFNSDPTDAAGWSATGTEAVTPIDELWERVKVTDQQPATSLRFGRLRVTQP